MAGENIFAIRLSQPQPQEVTPPSFGGVQFEDGFRAILSVTTVVAKLQTTVLFGNSLYMIWYDIGPLSRQDGFKAFLRPYFGTPIPAGQLSQPPFAATPSLYMLVGRGNIAPPAPPVAVGTVTMLDAGFDAFRGYWIEFANNYFLPPPNGFPLFQNWPNVIRDTANYKGAQPSANNPNPKPGSGGSGGGVGGSGTGGNGPLIC
jgi:hypothetical protein